MQNPGVFITVVYPKALPYLCDVCKSAKMQTRQDFDILVVNDGCDSESIKAALPKLNVIIINAADGFSANRTQGIEYAKAHNYEYLLFCDADDTFSPVRYEHTIEAFEQSDADIIVSNLNIVDEKLNILIKDYFSKEIPLSCWIDANFVQDKNIFGMSNTAIRLSALHHPINIPETPIVDWYLFTTLLLDGLNAWYTKESFVGYRQYSDNMIGINKFDVTSVRNLTTLKLNHYKLLIENGRSEYQGLYNDTARLLHLTDEEIENIIGKEINIHPQPLWWQIIKTEDF